MVCEELHSADEALHLAERVRTAVAQPLLAANDQLRPTVSIGVATAPPHGFAAELLAAADLAAYRAKRAGRNRVRH